MDPLTRVHLLPIHPDTFNDSSIILNYKTRLPPENALFIRPCSDSERQKQARWLQTELMNVILRHSDCVVYRCDQGFTVWIAADVVPSIIGGQANEDTTIYYQGPEIKTCNAVQLLFSPSATKNDNPEPSPKSWYQGIWNSLSLNYRNTSSLQNHPNVQTSIQQIQNVNERIKRKLKKKSIAVMPGTFFRYGNQKFLLIEKISVQCGVAINPPEIGASPLDSLEWCMMPGLVGMATLIEVRLDEIGYFSKVHVSAFEDTIPRAYSVDIFEDYLRPYLYMNGLSIFCETDIFEIRAIQFKILATEPSSTPIITSVLDSQASTTSLLAAPFLIDDLPPGGGYRYTNVAGRKRIGPLTKIYLGAPILPQWMDILDSEQQAAVRFLPSHLQTFAIIRFIGESHPHDIERVMNTLQFVNSQHIASTPINHAQAFINQLKQEYQPQLDDEILEHCSVCLSTINHSDLIQLPCKHKFHYDCILHWFVRTPTCPLCKQLFDNP